MFDLKKLNENLKAGTDRVGRMLGKTTVRELKNNAFKKTIKTKDSDADSRDSETELRSPEG